MKTWIKKKKNEEITEWMRNKSERRMDTEEKYLWRKIDP